MCLIVFLILKQFAFFFTLMPSSVFSGMSHRLVSDDELSGGTMSCCPTDAPSKDAAVFPGGSYQ